MSDATVTIRICGNSPGHGDRVFAAGVTLGEVFDAAGPTSRDERFLPSHTLAIRRWHQVKPHTIVFHMVTDSWRDFPLRDKDNVIYQYDVTAAVGGAG